MGQYYKAALWVEDTQGAVTLYCIDPEASKIHEHSYFGVDFMSEVEIALSSPGLRTKDVKAIRLKWIGDYDKLYPSILEGVGYKAPEKAVYDTHPLKYRYLLNHTKKEYVDKKFCPISSTERLHSTSIYYTIVHPLSLLVVSDCFGEGSGENTFSMGNPVVGRWCGDDIEPSNKIPVDYDQLQPNFISGHEH